MARPESIAAIQAAALLRDNRFQVGLAMSLKVMTGNVTWRHHLFRADRGAAAPSRRDWSAAFGKAAVLPPYLTAIPPPDSH
jgi:hypothetical protein